MLQFKRILFIAPNFFNYSLLIKYELESMGAIVDLFNIKPSTNSSKIIEILSLQTYEKIKSNYFKKLSKRIKKEYDYILIIRADLIPNYFLLLLREKYCQAKFIQYVWDDIALFPYLLNTFKYFDKVLSYDLIDSEKYNLVFRPFFFVELLNIKKELNNNQMTRLFFIGSYHTDRMQILNKVIKLNPKINIKFHFYINPLMFILSRVPIHSFRIFKFHKMKYKDMIHTINNSVAILDIQNISQNGLTTRVYEALGSKCKVITTNSNILKYEFYNTNNFLIIDRNIPLIDECWIEKPYQDYDSELINKYSIKSWIKDVLNFNIT